MKIIICLDENNGMLFNRRRQSQDEQVRSRVMELIGGSQLWMNAYSKKQFAEETENIVVDEEFLAHAPDSAYCFVENADPAAWLDRVDTLVIYRWNRSYPSDVKAPTELLGKNWKKKSCMEFPGKSHDRITEEIFVL